MAVCQKSIQCPAQCPRIGVLTFSFDSFYGQCPPHASGQAGALAGALVRKFGAHWCARGGRTGGRTEGALRVQAYYWGNTFFAHGHIYIIYMTSYVPTTFYSLLQFSIVFFFNYLLSFPYNFF